MNGGTDVAVKNAVEKGMENVNGDPSRTFCPPDLLPVNIAENDTKIFHSQPESKNDMKNNVMSKMSLRNVEKNEKIVMKKMP